MGIRRLWVLHNPNDRTVEESAQAERTEEVFEEFQCDEPATLLSFPVRSVEWEPEEPMPFSVFDLLKSAKPLARCKTLAEAEKLATEVDRKVS